MQVAALDVRPQPTVQEYGPYHEVYGRSGGRPER